MGLNPDQKKFETQRIVTAVRTLFEDGQHQKWTASQLGNVLTTSLGTDGAKESVGNNETAAAWVLDGLHKAKAMTQNDDGTLQVTEESVFQYNNKSSFFVIKAPIGTIKIRQGAVVTIV